MKAIYARFERDTHYLGRLTKLRQIGTVADFLTAFEQLAIRTEGFTNSFYKECQTDLKSVSPLNLKDKRS